MHCLLLTTETKIIINERKDLLRLSRTDYPDLKEKNTIA